MVYILELTATSRVETMASTSCMQVLYRAQLLTVALYQRRRVRCVCLAILCADCTVRVESNLAIKKKWCHFPPCVMAASTCRATMPVVLLADTSVW